MRLTCDVIERIIREPQLDGERVTVHVQNRVVNLSGVVSSSGARTAVADLARSTPGVTDICNRLELARTADVTATLERPDPFDDLVAHLDDERDDRRIGARATLLGIMAALAAVISVALWLILLPRLGGVGLLVVLPCGAVAVVMAGIAGRMSSHGPGRGSP
ncbi:BON domain-containing protein [Actinoplanes sp. CA-054009]